jgi:hypothetical protein
MPVRPIKGKTRPASEYCDTGEWSVPRGLAGTIRHYILADRTVTNRRIYSENYYLDIILGFLVNELRLDKPNGLQIFEMLTVKVPLIM